MKYALLTIHKYSAYEDELASAEYAWVFGKRDSVFVRHADGIDNITQYLPTDKPRVIIKSDWTSYSQAILHLVMKEFDTTLKRFDDRRPYFYGFKWHHYRI